MVAGTRLGDGVTGDAALIAAVRTGDAASFGTLYERHAGAAWVVARQYTDSRADADDVVADAFTAVHGSDQLGVPCDAVTEPRACHHDLLPSAFFVERTACHNGWIGCPDRNRPIATYVMLRRFRAASSGESARSGG